MPKKPAKYVEITLVDPEQRAEVDAAKSQYKAKLWESAGRNILDDKRKQFRTPRYIGAFGFGFVSGYYGYIQYWRHVGYNAIANPLWYDPEFHAKLKHANAMSSNPTKAIIAATVGGIITLSLFKLYNIWQDRRINKNY